MSISTYIAKRLSVSGETGSAYAPAVVVASGGISLALMIMIIAVAVTSGFKSEIISKIEGFGAQIRITAANYGVSTTSRVALTPEMISEIENDLQPFSRNKPDVASTSSMAGMLKSDSVFTGIVFKSYNPEAIMAFEHKMLKEGLLPAPDSPNEITISAATASQLKVSLGDKVNAYFISDGGIRQRRFKVAGIYESNFSEFDNSIAYASHQIIKSLNCNNSSDTAISPNSSSNTLITYADALEVRGIDRDKIEDATRRLQHTLNTFITSGKTSQLLSATPITATAAGYFNWLDMLDTNIWVILILMGCVSALMVVACVLILVLRRVRTIGILKALGASNLQIEKTFTLLAGKVIAVGVLIGNTFSLGFIFLQKNFHIIPLNPENYYINFVPVDIDFTAWLAINLGFISLAIAVAMLPSMLVRSLSPTKTMRWE